MDMWEGAEWEWRMKRQSWAGEWEEGMDREEMLLSCLPLPRRASLSLCVVYNSHTHMRVLHIIAPPSFPRLVCSLPPEN